ncbi:hypothetical protein tb265_07170 [Gemmatimonadetes bacterium T265]|nr:hypothetical protein tb265_07170 [Gemmatimonadetes bacterium T265]
MRIASRYILKEHLGPLSFSLGALTSLLLLNYIARKFADLVGKGLPWQVIAEFFMLSVPFTVAMTLPMAVLVSTLYAFSRLAAENEITAFKASGVAMRRLLVPVLWAAAGLALLMVAFNDVVLPAANHRLAVLQNDVARARPTFGLNERVINQVGERQFFLSAGHIDRATSRMREVTIYDLTQATPRTVRADSGSFALAPNHRDLTLTLYDGVIEQVGAGKPDDLTRTYYKVQLARVRDVAKGPEITDPKAQTYKSDREMTICELDTAFQSERVKVFQARVELGTAIADSLRRPHKAEAQRGPAAPARSIGRLYCAARTRLASALSGAVLPRQAHAQGLKSAVIDPREDAGIRAMNAGALAIARLRVGEAEAAMNGYDVEIHKKFALAVACISFVLLGAPLALRFPRGGVGMVLGVSLGVFATYYAFLIAGQELAQRGTVPPWLAMWGADILFTAVGLAMAMRMGRESGSARGGGIKEWIEQWRWRRQARRDARAANTAGRTSGGVAVAGGAA